VPPSCELLLLPWGMWRRLAHSEGEGNALRRMRAVHDGLVIKCQSSSHPSTHRGSMFSFTTAAEEETRPLWVDQPVLLILQGPAEARERALSVFRAHLASWIGFDEGALREGAHALAARGELELSGALAPAHPRRSIPEALCARGEQEQGLGGGLPSGTRREAAEGGGQVQVRATDPAAQGAQWQPPAGVLAASGAEQPRAENRAARAEPDQTGCAAEAQLPLCGGASRSAPSPVPSETPSPQPSESAVPPGCEMFIFPRNLCGRLLSCRARLLGVLEASAPNMLVSFRALSADGTRRFAYSEESRLSRDERHQRDQALVMVGPAEGRARALETLRSAYAGVPGFDLARMRADAQALYAAGGLQLKVKEVRRLPAPSLRGGGGSLQGRCSLDDEPALPLRGGGDSLQGRCSLDEDVVAPGGFEPAHGGGQSAGYDERSRAAPHAWPFGSSAARDERGGADLPAGDERGARAPTDASARWQPSSEQAALPPGCEALIIPRALSIELVKQRASLLRSLETPGTQVMLTPLSADGSRRLSPAEYRNLPKSEHKERNEVLVIAGRAEGLVRALSMLRSAYAGVPGFDLARMRADAQALYAAGGLQLTEGELKSCEPKTAGVEPAQPLRGGDGSLQGRCSLDEDVVAPGGLEPAHGGGQSAGYDERSRAAPHAWPFGSSSARDKRGGADLPAGGERGAHAPADEAALGPVSSKGPTPPGVELLVLQEGIECNKLFHHHMWLLKCMRAHGARVELRALSADSTRRLSVAEERELPHREVDRRARALLIAGTTTQREGALAVLRQAFAADDRFAFDEARARRDALELFQNGGFSLSRDILRLAETQPEPQGDHPALCGMPAAVPTGEVQTPRPSFEELRDRDESDIFRDVGMIHVPSPGGGQLIGPGGSVRRLLALGATAEVILVCVKDGRGLSKEERRALHPGEQRCLDAVLLVAGTPIQRERVLTHAQRLLAKDDEWMKRARERVLALRSDFLPQGEEHQLRYAVESERARMRALHQAEHASPLRRERVATSWSVRNVPSAAGGGTSDPPGPPLPRARTRSRSRSRSPSRSLGAGRGPPFERLGRCQLDYADSARKLQRRSSPSPPPPRRERDLRSTLNRSLSRSKRGRSRSRSSSSSPPSRKPRHRLRSSSPSPGPGRTPSSRLGTPSRRLGLRGVWKISC
jgi:hypothetical protein